MEKYLKNFEPAEMEFLSKKPEELKEKAAPAVHELGSEMHALKEEPEEKPEE